MKLLGDWNWYLPKWLEWLPRLEHEHGAGGASGPGALAASVGAGRSVCGSPSQQPSLKRHLGHCQVPWRHSIGAAHRKQDSVALGALLIFLGKAA